MLVNDYTEEYYSRLYEKAIRLAKQGIEIWRDVRENEGQLQVSNLGLVKMLDRIDKVRTPYGDLGERFIRGRMIKLNINPKNGYASVWATNQGKCKRRYVHHLVLETFFGPKPDWAVECRHLNGIRTDNKINNLLWGTCTEQAQDKKTHGTLRYGENAPYLRILKLTDAKVIEARKQYRSGKYTIEKLARTNHVNSQTMSDALYGRTWAHVTEESPITKKLRAVADGEGEAQMLKGMHDAARNK